MPVERVKVLDWIREMQNEVMKVPVESFKVLLWNGEAPVKNY